MATADAAKEAVYLISFLKELGCSDLANITIYNDNRGAGLLAHNPIYHSRSKHIDIKHHFVRDILKKHPVNLIHLSSEEMIADVLTKGLPGPKHTRCTQGFGLRPRDHHRAQLEGEC